jgi:predicted NBD/HSP70 family sugar kinase
LKSQIWSFQVCDFFTPFAPDSLGSVRRIDLQKAQAARSNTIRDINRQIVLNYVREREPISRAEIARETELQRSTVSSIVEVLQAEGLVEEIGEGESTGGRRPTLLRLRAAEPVAVGVAVTPTTTFVAASDLAGRILERQEFPTEAVWETTRDKVVKSVHALRLRHPALEALGVSFPGLVDKERGEMLYVPFFDWHKPSCAKDLAELTGLPTAIDNDANAAALAELWFGRQGPGQARDFLMILVGAGIGVGTVFDGQVYCGQHGAAGEFGHMIIGSEAPTACSCGNYDCWEAFASERAALARYHAAGGSPALKDFAELVTCALKDEPAARDALLETAHYLGIGVSNLIVGFSPGAVLICGPIVRAWALIEQALSETIGRSVRRGLSAAPILPSALGEQPALMGALSLVLAHKFSLQSS